MDTLFGRHHLPIPRVHFARKRISKDGILCAVLQKVSAGICCHSKMKLLCGKRQVKRVVMVPGEVTDQFCI